MRGDLPPHVDEGTDYLYEQGCRQDGSHEMGDMHHIHQVNAEEITEDGDDIRHHTALLMTQLYQIPALITTIEMDQHRRQQNREDIYQCQHLQLIGPRH